MPRYEFSEGSSNKFWQIDLSGKSFTTTYGKIGTNGQTTIKTFKTDADAKKEYDKLIAEKVKKGYEAADGAEDEDEEEEEDEEEDEKPTKKAAAAKPAAKAAAKPAAKAAAKPAAKAAAKPAKAAAKPAAAAGGDKTTPRYFEFSEGTSNKFWEVRLDGNSVRTRYGKIGSSGQQTLKDYANAAAATKEYDKLVAEKTKKGYEETDAPEADNFDEIEE